MFPGEGDREAAGDRHPGAGDTEDGEGAGEQGDMFRNSPEHPLFQVRAPADAEKFRLEKIAEAERGRAVLEAEAEVGSTPACPYLVV